MRLISIHDIGSSLVDEKIFRVSVTRSIIVFTIFFILFLICIGHYVCYSISYSVGFWLTLVYLWFAFWFGFIAILAWYRYRAGRLSSNWLVRSSPEKVLVKFRSFQNHNYPDTDDVVIDIYWREIDSVRKTKAISHKPGSDGGVTEFITYLDMKLALPNEEIESIKAGLSKERALKPLRSKVGELKSELFHARKNKLPKYDIEDIKQRLRHEKSTKNKSMRSRAKYHDYPVSLVDNTVLRLRWNGIKPDIKKSLLYFSEFTQVADEIKLETDSSGEFKGKELDEMILDRITKGDKLDAISLVQRHYGYSTTEAKIFVEDLIEHQPGKQSGT